jgi:anaerobic dimethyl sulfoxide reductase subunit A
MAAVGATRTIFGYSAEDGVGETIKSIDPAGIEPPDVETDDCYYICGKHNCHVRCVSKAWVKDGRIVRVTSVGEEARPGLDYAPDSYGNPQQRSCGKCRGYKYRLSHPGRLKYPLKQTKLRGDLSGFIRVSWDQALNEITRKHNAIINKYGPESIHSVLGSGNDGGLQAGGYSGPDWGSCQYIGLSALALRYVGGSVWYAGDYSFHQDYNWNNAYIGYPAAARPNLNQLAGGSIKNIVSFGDNSLTTKHNRKQAQAAAYAMARKNGTKVTYIAPEFVATGLNIADEFIPTKPYTTAALMTGMLHEMLINTFDENGNILPNPWLDVEYLDTAVYGFFDSPEYWVRTT